MAFFVDLVTMDEPQLKMLLVVDRSHPVLIHIFQCSCSTFAGWATRRSAILSFKQLFALGLWLGTGRLGKSPCLVSILLFSVLRSLGRDIHGITVLPRVRTEIRKRGKKRRNEKNGRKLFLSWGHGLLRSAMQPKWDLHLCAVHWMQTCSACTRTATDQHLLIRSLDLFSFSVLAGGFS